jgi:hypothetical protein
MIIFKNTAPQKNIPSSSGVVLDDSLSSKAATLLGNLWSPHLNLERPEGLFLICDMTLETLYQFEARDITSYFDYKLITFSDETSLLLWENKDAKVFQFFPVPLKKVKALNFKDLVEFCETQAWTVGTQGQHTFPYWGTVVPRTHTWKDELPFFLNAALHVCVTHNISGIQDFLSQPKYILMPCSQTITTFSAPHYNMFSGPDNDVARFLSYVLGVYFKNHTTDTQKRESLWQKRTGSSINPNMIESLTPNTLTSSHDYMMFCKTHGTVMEKIYQEWQKEPE